MKLNIIVIDDSPIQLMIASKLIQQNDNLNLLGAYSNPILGLRAVNNASVDVVLLDVEMPEMDGFSFKKSIDKEVPVIMNSTRKSFSKKAKNAGVLDFLAKPLSAMKLRKAVSKLRPPFMPGNIGVFPAIAS